MRLVAVTVGLLGIIIVSLGLVWVTPEAPLSAGGPHPDIPNMRIGGEGERFAPIAWPVIVMQTAVLLFAAALMVMGVNPRNRSGGFWLWFSLATGVCVVTWFAVIATYLAFLRTGETPIVLGFPLPTALTIYGIWGAAASYMLLFVFGFRRYFFTAEDEVAYERLVDEIRAEREAGQ